MKIQEIVDMLISVKGKRKGIDKATKDAIKKNIKDGNFDDIGRFHIVNIIARSIAEGMNDNDFFQKEELAVDAFKEAEKLAEDGDDFATLIEGIMYSETIPNSVEWINSIAEKMMKLDDVTIRELLKALNEIYNPDNEITSTNREMAVKILEFALSRVEKENSAVQLLSIANEYYYLLDEKETAVQFIVNAIKENKLDQVDEIMSNFYYSSAQFKEDVEKAIN